MSPVDCRDKVKLSLSDESGVLRVKAFNIVNAPECQELAESLRGHLLSRSLKDIDVIKIREMACCGDGLCGHTVADIIEEYQSMFKISKETFLKSG